MSVSVIRFWGAGWALAVVHFPDLVLSLMGLYQCFLYVSCSSVWRPWWLLASAFACDRHCGCQASCRGLSAAAACVLSLDDATFGGTWHAANIVAALCAPLFPPKKKSKTGAHLLRGNRQKDETVAKDEVIAEIRAPSEALGYFL